MLPLSTLNIAISIPVLFGKSGFLGPSVKIEELKKLDKSLPECESDSNVLVSCLSICRISPATTTSPSPAITPNLKFTSPFCTALKPDMGILKSSEPAFTKACPSKTLISLNRILEFS